LFLFLLLIGYGNNQYRNFDAVEDLFGFAPQEGMDQPAFAVCAHDNHVGFHFIGPAPPSMAFAAMNLREEIPLKPMRIG